jgi:hypothetical protein
MARSRDHENHTLERVAAGELSRVVVVAPPWLAWIATLTGGLLLRLAWPQWEAAACVGSGGLVLSVLAAHLTRHREGLGRYLAAVTVLLAFGWLATAEAAGLTRVVVGVWFIGGMVVAFGWSMWVHIHEGGDEAGVHHLFGRAAKPASLEGAKVLSVKLAGRKTHAVVQHPPGGVTADLIKRAPNLESAMGLPPKSITVSPHEDHAGRSHVVFSDPRVLKTPVPWPGPSRPGASIAEPVRLGLWQDSEPMDYRVVNHHNQVMGATGVGKTMSMGWCEIAETVTRYDAAVLAFDITKGEQFLGPLRPALHCLETTPEEARARLRALHPLVRARTDYLATQHLPSWREGCGLTHLTIWLEECPDIIALLDDDDLEAWLSDVKAGRSAGIRWVLSLQRSDWTQMPTLARGQLAKTCFGVLDDQDASFGLSARQADAGCSPEHWGSSQPGMAYIDAPSIPDDRRIMPWRAFFWGDDSHLIAAHAAEWPATDRPLDHVTAAALADLAAAPVFPAENPRPATVATAPATTHPATLHVVEPPEVAEGDDEPVADIEVDEDTPFGAWKFGGDAPASEPMDAATARDVVRRQLNEWRLKGQTTFGIPELSAVRERTGRSRPWLYDVLAEFERDGVLRQRGTSPWTWEIQSAA